MVIPSPQAGPSAVAAFDAVVTSDVIPTNGHWCTFQETQWSYRRPISYRIFDPAGNLVGTVAPTDGATRSTSLVRIGERTRLILALDRRGSTSVSDEHGHLIGAHRAPRWPAFSARLRLDCLQSGRQVATLTAPPLARSPVDAVHTGGGVAARIDRQSQWRFAGSPWSWLYTFGVGPGLTPVRPALLLAAIPAIDAYLRQIRRRTSR